MDNCGKKWENSVVLSPIGTEVIASHLFHLYGHGGQIALTKASGSDDVAMDVLRCAARSGEGRQRFPWRCYDRCYDMCFANAKQVNLLQLLLEQPGTRGK